MAKPTSPFAGIKLSDQTNPGNRKLDQQLFAPSPKKQTPPVIPAQEPHISGTPESQNSRSPGIRESGKPVIRESGIPELRNPGTRGIRENDTASSAHHLFVFNLNDVPSIKETFLITDGEYESMEDMKLRLRRLLDMKASKQDIIRCAVQHVLEDFQKHPETSIIVSRLKQKKSK
jgi:hypothetical protein